MTVLLPTMLIALEASELDTTSHEGELKLKEPLNSTAWLAVALSESMQAGLDIVATARALTTGLLDRKRPENNRGRGCWMTTSIAVVSLV